MKDNIRLQVILPIVGMKFVASDEEEITIESVKPTGRYSYTIGEILDLSAEKKNALGAVTHWRVKAYDHDDIVISVAELSGWRHECVIEIALAA
jgi:hypothetical protein